MMKRLMKKKGREVYLCNQLFSNHKRVPVLWDEWIESSLFGD